MKFSKILKKWLYGACPGFSGSFPYFGTKVYFPPNSLIFQMACDQGIYENENLKLISSLISPNSTYFDVGANIGLMSLPLLRSCPSCKVVSVEASPNSLPFLKKTFEESVFSDRWHIVEKAFGSSNGNIDFYMYSSNLGAFDGFLATQEVGNSSKVNVEVTTLDLEWESLKKPQVSFIKIDVEGAELQVLKGSMSCIKECRPYILVEWNKEWLKKFNYEAQSILEFCKSIQYDLLSVPYFCLINSPILLELNMLRTESFLLIPSELQNN